MSRASYLRRNATEAERKLWRILRNRNFDSYKFRRQHAIDEYILDFYCAAARLVVEVDGGGHGYPTNERRDLARTQRLQAKGIRVLRFWNHQICEDIDAVRDTIWTALQEQTRNNPSP